MTNPADPLAAHAAMAPDRPAVVEAGVVTTYADLNREVNRLANGLRTLELSLGDRAVWCGPNSRHVLTFMHAARKVGLVTVPLAYRFTGEEMRHVIDDSDAALVVVDNEQAPLIAELRRGGRIPKVREFLVYPGEADGFHAWGDVLARGDEAEPPPPEPGGLGAAMMYTSGTTGRPKGALRTRTDPALLAAMLGELRFGHEEVHLTTGPLYHAGPNAFALITQIVGGTVVVMRSFDAEEWTRLVTGHRVTSTFSAPTQMKRVVTLPPPVLGAADFSSLRTLIVNAAPVPYGLKREIIAKLGDGFLYETYGSTELGIDTILKPEDQLRKPGSCGRPYGGIEITIVGEDGQQLPRGETGEIYIRTALAIDRYHGGADQMADLGEGWKSVGDVGYLDDEGYLYICDRKTDTIITGGVNVYPAEVEEALHDHPGVMDVAVLGLPDDHWGERVHAVVQPWPGAAVDLGELAAHAAQRLAGYKIPRSWDVRRDLPRTDSGKLLKRVLRAEYTGALAAE